MCAIVYVFAAVWTMSVFSLYRSALQFLSIPVRDEYSDVNSDPIADDDQSLAIGSVQIEDGVTWISAPFVTGVMLTCSTAVFVSSLFFALIPRVWIPTSGALTADESPISGSSAAFAAEVRLGDMGPILARMDPVLQMRIGGTGPVPMSPQSYAERLGLAEPLFRGAVLSVYDAPSWKVDPQSRQRPQRMIPAGTRNLVRQEIRMQDVGTDALLCMGTPHAVVDQEEQPRGTFLMLTGLIFRNPDLNRRGAVRYAVYSELPPPGRSSEGIVVVSDLVRARYDQLGYIERNKEVPGGLKRLGNLARQVVADARKRRGGMLSELETVRAMESFLRDSGEYKYSLNLSINDPTIDPVEDFLFNRHEGHCEYFASALVLMLRSVGIPARLISGYKGGNYDEATRTLNVQQRHAHAWCEAWIENRAWVTVDATPVDERSASVEAVSANRSVWNDMRSQLAGLWSENVVNISLEQQDEVFYRPIRELFRSVGKVLKEIWESPKSSIAAFFELLFDPRRWFSPQGAGALFLAVATTWLVQRIVRRLIKRWGRERMQTGIVPGRQIEFYERFARLMQSLDLHRDETQTQLEFAHQTAEVLRPKLQPAGLTCGPEEISDLFYKVRFGDESLPEIESQRLEKLLVELEITLRPAVS